MEGKQVTVVFDDGGKFPMVKTLLLLRIEKPMYVFYNNLTKKVEEINESRIIRMEYIGVEEDGRGKGKE